MWITVKGSKWTYSVYNVSNFFPHCVFMFIGGFFWFGPFVGGVVCGFFLTNGFFFLKDSDGKYFAFPLASHRKSYSHVYCENSMLVRKYFFNV